MISHKNNSREQTALNVYSQLLKPAHPQKIFQEDLYIVE